MEEVLSGAYDIQRAPSSCRLIVDLGAHIGTFSRLASSRFRAASIVAIEPCWENFEILKTNLKKAPQAIAVHAAIGDPCSRYTWKRSCVPDNTGGGGVEPDPSGDVRGIRLSDIIRVHGPIDLLKSDCEGAEWLWLLDLQSTNLLSQVNVIVGEIHGKDWSDRLHLHLKSTHDIVMCEPVSAEVAETQGYFTAVRKEAA